MSNETYPGQSFFHKNNPRIRRGERNHLVARITQYLFSGGLFNPEMMNHQAVRDLLIDCRDELMLIEPKRCGACGHDEVWCSVYTGCPLNKGKAHDLKYEAK